MKAFDVFYSSYYAGRGSFVVYARTEKSAWKKADDVLKARYRDLSVESGLEVIEVIRPALFRDYTVESVVLA